MDVLAAVALKVEDDDLTVRIAATETLVLLGGRKGIPPDIRDLLLHVLGNDPNADVRKVALRRLAHGESMDYVQCLTQPDIASLLRFLDDADPSVRQDAAAIVGHLRAGGFLDVASILQGDGNPDLQLGPLATCELWAMAPAFVPQLMAKLQDSRAEVRVCAADALARVNKRFGWTIGRRDEAVPALAELLHDKVREVRVAAVRALDMLRKASWPDVDLILAGSPNTRITTNASSQSYLVDADDSRIRSAGAGRMPPACQRAHGRRA